MRRLMFLDLGWGFESVVTAVAVHPRHDAVPAGYKDGAAILVHTGRTQTVLVKQPGD